ncbi:MAG: hypothetical protein ACE5DX_04975 [Candidatus Dojkabacteria bacterium]
MMKFIKGILKVLVVIGAVYAGFQITRKINSGQLDLGLPEKKDDNGDDLFRPKKVSTDIEPPNLTPRQQEIFDLVKASYQIEMKDIERQITGVTRRTLRRDMDRLEAEGLVRQEGKTKSARYVLNEEL